MRKLFEEIGVRLASFIEQRDRLAMIAQLGAREHIAVCKVLQDMDEGASRHVFCVFTEPFSNPQHYVDTIVEASRVRHQELLTAAAMDGTRTFPPFPLDALDSRYAPESRLRELLIFARGLIPHLDEQLLVVALLPLEIEDPRAYSSLLEGLLTHEFPAPWCHHMRFILREQPTTPTLAGALAAVRRQLYAPDLGDGAVERSLAAEIDDGTVPIAQRMQSLMILAGMDSSHRRTQNALDKYQLLAEYHHGLGNLPALALALNGMGEACALIERNAEAREHFERALTPAIDARDVPTLTSISFNLARLHQSQGEWSQAIQYYDGLSNLARASLSSALQVICHEHRGVCHRALSEFDRALDEWSAGAELSEGSGMLDHQLLFLRRSAELLRERGRTSEVRALEGQMNELRKAGAQELPL
jgi:hypothetical protein